jgi:isoleucyl-tRNA synthetase
VTEKKKQGLELALEDAKLRWPIESEKKPVFAWGDRERTWGVWLETAITEELRRKGTVREFVHRLQSLRKTAELEVSDRIVLYYEAGAKLASILESFKSYIASEALAERIESKLPEGGGVEEWTLDGEKVKIALRKAE